MIYLEVCLGIMMGLSTCGMDSIFLVAIYHLCAHLIILQKDLRKIDAEGPSSKDQYVEKLVRKHQDEIR